jgi:hypothetical protein
MRRLVVIGRNHQLSISGSVCVSADRDLSSGMLGLYIEVDQSQQYDFNQTWEKGFGRTQALLTRQRFYAVYRKGLSAFSHLFIQHVFRVGHSEKAELYSSRDQT